MKTNKIVIAMLLFALFAFSSYSIMASKSKTDTKKTAIKTDTNTLSKSDTKTDTKPQIKTTTKTKTGTTVTNPILGIDQPQPTTTAPATGETIPWQVLSSGGTNGSSTNFSMSGTLGQTSAGPSSSPSFNLNSGYWQDFEGGSCCVLPGDVNLSGGVDIADVTYTVNYMFKGGPPPLCNDNADINATCGIDIADLTYRVNYMFKGGPAPLCGCVGGP